MLHSGARVHLLDELPRVSQSETKPETDYDQHEMDLEIQRVARELYKAFNGLNSGFKEVSRGPTPCLPSDLIIVLCSTAALRADCY